MLPCGTPDETGTTEDWEPLMDTNCWRLDK